MRAISMSRIITSGRSSWIFRTPTIGSGAVAMTLISSVEFRISVIVCRTRAESSIIKTFIAILSTYSFLKIVGPTVLSGRSSPKIVSECPRNRYPPGTRCSMSFLMTSPCVGLSK